MKHGYHANIEKLTETNKNFRKVIYTAKHMQLVLMSLLPKQAIGLETHDANDQFFRIESGEGTCIINDKSYTLKSGSALVIPAGAKHNITNTSTTEDLKMYTLYSPPHHKDGIVRKTKETATKNEEEFDGETTE